MSFAYACSVLVKEPFGLTIADIRRLTPFQVRRVYFREPEPKVAPGQQSNGYEQVFFAHWRRMGWKERHIREKWQAYLEEQ